MNREQVREIARGWAVRISDKELRDTTGFESIIAKALINSPEFESALKALEKEQGRG